MSICKNCGSEINENSKFCTKCGTPVEKETVKKETQKTVEKKEEKPKKEIDPREKKKRTILIALALVVLIGGFSLYSVGKSLTSKERLVESFATALEEGNASEVAALLVPTDPETIIVEKHIQPLLDHVEEYPGYVEHLVEELNGANEGLSGFKRGEREDEEVNDQQFYIRKNGKKYLFFDNYEIVAQEYFVRVETDYDGAVIHINGEEKGTYTEGDITYYGPYYPGKHMIKVTYDGEYTDLEEEVAEYLMYETYSEDIVDQDIYVELGGDYAIVDSEYYDSSIFVDGKDIGTMVGDQWDHDSAIDGIGPIAEDSKIYIQKEFPWGTIRSEEVVVGDVGYYAYLDLDIYNDTLNEQLVSAITKYLEDNEKVIESYDMSIYTNLIGPRYTSEEEYINDAIEDGKHELIEMKKIMIDMDSIEVYYNGHDDIYEANINVRYSFEVASYYDDDEDVDLDNLEYEDRLIQFKAALIYDPNHYDDRFGDEWLVSNLLNLSYFSQDNLKEIAY